MITYINFFISFRNEWTLDEDIVLLEKSLQNPKKWAKISVHCYGRNQHNIKNRFIALINKEFKFKWEQTKDMMRRNDLENLIKKTLESLYEKKKEIAGDAQLLQNAEEKKNIKSCNPSLNSDAIFQKDVHYNYGEKKQAEEEEEQWLDSLFLDFKYLY